MQSEQAKLSPRQQEICALVIAGRSSKQIGAELGISYRTVQAHRDAIYHKIGVHSAIELVAKLTTQRS